MALSVQVLNRIEDKGWSSYARIAVCTLFGILIYSLLLTKGLVCTNDPTWNGDFYYANGWELSLGRFCDLVLDYVRFGMALDPLHSIIAIFMFSIGIEYANRLLATKGLMSYLVPLVFMASTTVCACLSYRYTSWSFALGFMLTTMAAWYLFHIKHPAKAAAVSGLLIALMMGCYQADIGCYCVLCLVAFALAVLKGKSWKELGGLVGRAVLALLVGYALYELLLNICLLATNVDLSSFASYKGSNDISLVNSFLHLSDGVSQAYGDFISYFTSGSLKHNIFQTLARGAIVLPITAAIVLLAAVVTGFKVIGSKPVRLFVYLVLFALVPMAANFALVLAPGNVLEIQMATPEALCISMALGLIVYNIREIFQGWEQVHASFCRFAKVAMAVVVSFIILSDVGMAEVDQAAMDDGMRSVQTLEQMMLEDIVDAGIDVQTARFAFFGNATDNSLFFQSHYQSVCNRYAKYGSWFGGAVSNWSWTGTYENQLGIRLERVTDTEYLALFDSDLVKSMTEYPAEGSIKTFDGTVVVKVA